MGEHAKFSPSKLNEISLCPGMPNAIAALPPDERDTKSEAADTGTRRHALLEWKAYHPTEPWPTQVWEYKITSEDVRLVQEVWKYLEKHPARGLGQGNLFLTETEVQIGAYLKLPVEDLWGTVDCVLVTADTVEIADAKFGNWQVEPDSWQLKAYAIGVIGDHLVDKATGQFHPQHRQIRNLRLTIMQPTGGGETIRSVEFPLTAVEVWMKEIKEIVLEAKDPEAPRVPGDKQCKFCPAASTCPARSALVQSEMEGAFEVLDDSPAPIASVDAITDIVDVKMREDPAAMSPDQIGRILDMEPLVTGWFADVRKRAMKMVEAGQDVPGWKLIAGKRSREWTKSEEELLAEFKSMGLSKQASYTHKLLSPNQAEQVEAIAGSKRRRERLSELWRWKEGKPTLAPDSDPAPALRDAENVFEDLGEPPAVPSEEPSWM